MGYYTTIGTLSDRVRDIDALIDLSKIENITLKNGLDLYQMQQNAVENLKGLLRALGYSDAQAENPQAAMEDLNHRIQEYHATTNAFNGPELRDNIMNPLKGIVVDQATADLRKFKMMMDGKHEQIQQVFLLTVDKIISNMELNEVGEITTETVANELYSLLNNLTLNFNTGAVELHGGTRITKDYKDLFKEVLKPSILKKIRGGIEASQFMGHTDPNINFLLRKDTNFTRRLLILARDQGIDVSGIFPEAESIAPTFEITETDDGLQLYYDIYKPFIKEIGGSTEKVAREYFEKLQEPKKSEMIKMLSDRAITYLDRFFPRGDLPASRYDELKSRFHKAITDIITGYPASLFVGGNEQGIIGILGEIQGLYYVYSIMGDLNPSIDPSTLAKWIGGDTTAGSGAKTGADIIMKIGEHLGYGIQVKNSMDVSGATTFSDYALSNVKQSDFSQQMINFGIDPSIVEAIEDVFIMKGFNIGYHYEGYLAVEGEPKGEKAPEYYTDYDQILSLIQRAQQFMALAAAMIMRIQYLQGENFMESNTLWIIGGSAMISAAQILNDLIDQIEGLKTANTFRTSSATYLNDSNYTIVQYLGRREDTSRLKTVLRTSYNFHKTTSRVTR